MNLKSIILIFPLWLSLGSGDANPLSPFFNKGPKIKFRKEKKKKRRENEMTMCLAALFNIIFENKLFLNSDVIIKIDHFFRYIVYFFNFKNEIK